MTLLRLSQEMQFGYKNRSIADKGLIIIPDMSFEYIYKYMIFPANVFKILLPTCQLNNEYYRMTQLVAMPVPATPSVIVITRHADDAR